MNATSRAILRRAVTEAGQAAEVAAPCACQGHAPAVAAPAAPRTTVSPVAVIGGVIVGGAVLSALFLAVALTAVAVSISGVVLLILIREWRNGGAR